MDPQQTSLLKLSHFAGSGVDSRNLKKSHTKIVFFDHASPKPAATSMLLYTTEEDNIENGKESPLKSIPDDPDLVKIEDVKEEAIEETMGHEAPELTTSPTPLREAKS